ncbi:hypothetical protein FHR83_001402 [Actinoplanes campanulatus]|uniref:Putative metallopeptidase domain-containing protein n=1 Tax=Actinoplanes campanulatus TaxID=113559 RepID=A0A7W5ACL7_9ACTN|nr:hypothetical protein [Actinoplanes campanulatus]MBB3093753.1 hypothetical protein [Actinoplanes campanulatus]GGN05412.1 hypothetical protein GCM10010109_12750 [Actinoplanes campanulatus]GID35169.1 hypothetical protein Aca09nite_16750 [Actinoplanes campanulatus]
MAAGFTLVADGVLAQSQGIAIAAVSAEAGEIYVNPRRSLSEEEWRFVLAHELLHVALRHADRVGGRDPYLWNVACDFVINGWLVEMGVGVMPDGTLRGQGAGDMLGEPLPWAGRRAGGVDLDEYCRRALLTGFAYHSATCCGSGGRTRTSCRAAPACRSPRGLQPVLRPPLRAALKAALKPEGIR